MCRLPAVWIVAMLHLASTLAGPIYAPQFLAGGTGRNIRHLPCVSLSTGETGVCMFAFTCVKSNGTHLGTCIDRFYFGSCCKLNDDADIHPQDNTIEDASAVSSFVTSGIAHESNDIPDYFTRPKPVAEKKPEATTPSTIGQTVSTIKQQQTPTKKTTTPTTTTTTTTMIMTTTTRPVPTTTPPKTTQKIVTKRPTFFSTPWTTTQPSIGLSTFQTLYDYSHGSGSSTTPNHRPNQSTNRPTTSTKNSTRIEATTATSSGLSSRPVLTTSSSTQGSSTITKKPITTVSKKPSITRKPSTPTTTTTTTTTLMTTTTRPIASTTERTSTRFPPRNATTTRPQQHTTIVRKPIQQNTKKPIATTKRPSTPTRRPITTKQPPVVTTSRPHSTTEKTATSIRVTQTHGPPPLTSTQETPTTHAPKPSTSSVSNTSYTRPNQRPIIGRPTTTVKPEKIVTTVKATTSRPSTSSAIPRPSSKPSTRPVATSSGRPTTPKTTTRPQQTSTEKSKPSTFSSTTPTVFSSVYTKPSTSKPTSAASTRPKPTEKPFKPFVSLITSSTTLAPSTTISTITHASTLLVTSLLLNDTTLANEILPPKRPDEGFTTESVNDFNQAPGLVTWSSNSDDGVTKAPEILSSTLETIHEGTTEPEWSPITTPDGWIMIQSPGTEKTPVTDVGNSTKPETTKIPTTSARPSSESVTTERVSTTRPTVPTLLSTIATVTAATDLPVPMETLNMSDYNQVCGRRLFPESRIVGGDHSSFGKWPWQISLRQWRTAAYLHKCGAALLNENWAITAAHCVENVPPSDLLLRIGEHDLANENEPYGFQERRVQIVASHPQFDPRTFEYDLALLRFYEPVLPFQPNLLPICLPDDDENYVGHTAYVTGWGRLYEDGPLPSVLQEVSVPVVNNTVCEGMYRNAGYIEHIPHIFICAGWRKGGFDSCEGDSGGPMVIQRPRDKRWILAGVISWGIGCAEPNQPGVYTRISEFREWINQILQF